jgi:16S rRNA (guanine(966)-N(2))-methyltransferase RsmD
MKLEAPEGLDTRPTAEMTKEAVFSIIQFEVEGANVLDLYAGSGQMGIEALSRGARHCVFVDSGRDCRLIMKRNLDHVKLADKARIMTSDALSFLKSTSGPFDIAFLDPPYQQGHWEKTLPLVAAAMSESGAILCETDRKETLPEAVGAFKKRKEYRYGKSKITLYRKDDAQ